MHSDCSEFYHILIALNRLKIKLKAISKYLDGYHYQFKLFYFCKY